MPISTKKIYKTLFWLRPISLFVKILKFLSLLKPIFFDQTSFYPKFVLNFENNFAKKINCNFGVTFSNGTSAIEAALFASGISKNTEVLVCGHTFHASIMAILNYGCKPKLIEVNEDLDFDIEHLKKNINENTSAIVLVHLWGIPLNVKEILEISIEQNIKIIEDSSHSYGAKFNDDFVGSIGSVGCFSLQGSKPIAAGEGGICVTKSEEIYKKLNFYGHFGRIKIPKFSSLSPHSEKTGYGKKLRANPLGIKIAQIDLIFFNYTNKIKNQNFQKLNKIFQNIPLFKSIYLNNSKKPGGFFGGFPIIYRGNDIDHTVNVFSKNGIIINRNPYFNLNKSKHIFSDEIRNKIFLNTEHNYVPNFEKLDKVDFLCSRLLLLDERYLIFLPNFIIKKIKLAIKKCY